MSAKKRLAVVTLATAVVVLVGALTGAVQSVIDLVDGKESTSTGAPNIGNITQGDRSVVIQGDHNTVNGLVGPQSSQSATPPTDGPTAGSLSIASSCGGPPDVQHPLPDAEICVIYWCKGVVYGPRSRRMLQIKLRPKVTNNSSRPLDVRIGQPSAILLLVGGRTANKQWEPPPRTAASTLKPRRVSVDGATFWALPPNVPGDFTKVSGGNYTGFGTTWDQTQIRPGSSYLETARDGNGDLVHHGNLVFELPMDARGDIHPVGLALINRQTGEVVAFQRYQDWGPPASPQSF